MKEKNKKDGIMKKEEKKVDFDLSILSLNELITLYGEITSFLQELDDMLIIIEEKGKKDDE